MTGPEHYEMAEELLGYAKENTLGSTVEHYHLAAAQVHATLALAAATIAAPFVGEGNTTDAWLNITSGSDDDVPGVPQ